MRNCEWLLPDWQVFSIVFVCPPKLDSRNSPVTCSLLLAGMCQGENLPMPFVDVSNLRVIERLPGWQGRYFHSSNMTFSHYDFVRGASIHEHFHTQGEVYEVIEGELEITIDGVPRIARPGVVAIVPGGVRHSIKALSDGRAIIVDYPVRRDFD